MRTPVLLSARGLAMLAFGILLGDLSPARAADGPRPPAEAFFARPDIARPLLSPSGRWLALLMPGKPGRNALAVVPLGEGEARQAKVVAGFDDVDIGRIHWAGDERLLFDVVDLQVGSGDRALGAGLLTVRRDGSRLRTLIRPWVKARGAFGLPASDPRPGRNHRLLQVPVGGGDDVVVGAYRSADGTNLDAVVLTRMNIDTGRSVEVPVQAPPRVTQWLFDPQGEPRVAMSRVQGQRMVYWRGPGQDRWALLDDSPSLASPWVPHSVDGQGRLYVTHAPAGNPTQVLARFDFATGRPEATALAATPGFDFAGQLLMDAQGQRLQGLRVEVEAQATVWLDPEMKALQAEVDARLPGRANRISCRRCSSGDRIVLITSHSDRDPGTVLLWLGRAGRLEVVGHVHPEIDPDQMARLALHRVPARDGLNLPVWLTLPPGHQADAGAPAVVLVHGGPWVRGGHWRWDALAQYLASRGLVVIEPEFRGSTGYGVAHFQAGWRQWGQAMQDDVADAVLWAGAQKLIDPKRVCIAGGSYGGYAALMGLVKQPELYRCAAAWAAVTDLERLLEGSWFNSDDLSTEARAYGLPTLVGDLKADGQMLKDNSPLLQAARMQAPVLLVHGEADRRVPLVHGQAMRDALTQAGRPPEWVAYPEEGHSWRKLETQRDFALRLERFLLKHLSPAPR